MHMSYRIAITILNSNDWKLYTNTITSGLQIQYLLKREPLHELIKLYNFKWTQLNKFIPLIFHSASPAPFCVPLGAYNICLVMMLMMTSHIFPTTFQQCHIKKCIKILNPKSGVIMSGAAKAKAKATATVGGHTITTITTITTSSITITITSD